MATGRRYWQEMRPADFAEIDPAQAVAVLPLGAVEQHGPHLPLMVDGCITEAILARALDRLPPDRRVIVLPTTWIGRSEEHSAYPGTLTLCAETLRRVWLETGASVDRAGIKKLLMLNGHGGQTQVMQIVARELRIRHGMLAVASSWFQLGLPEGLIDAKEQRHGIHAGEIETSLMLAIRPDLVGMEEAQDFVPLTARAEAQFPTLFGLGAAGFGWQAQDLHTAGVAGNAAAATAEKGKAILHHVAARLVDLLREVGDFPLNELEKLPGA